MLDGDRYERSRVLSEREHEIIRLVSAGDMNRTIAIKVGTTEHVVKNYLRVIYDKLGVWTRLELALWYADNKDELNATAHTAPAARSKRL